MDLETRAMNGVLEAICVSVFDGKECQTFFISDYANSEQMLLASLRYLLQPRFRGYKVYLHNFSYFDGVFLLKHIPSVCQKVTPIIRDGRIISLKIKYGKNYLITIFDSMNLLPAALEALARTFQVENKGIFPHNFVNNRSDINYVGEVPAFEEFIMSAHLKSAAAKAELQALYAEYVKKFSNKA